MVVRKLQMEMKRNEYVFAFATSLIIVRFSRLCWSSYRCNTHLARVDSPHRYILSHLLHVSRLPVLVQKKKEEDEDDDGGEADTTEVRDSFHLPFPI